VADDLVLRGERIVVPRELRESIVEIALEGHQGIVCTKQLLGAHVCFPGIYMMVEKQVGKCLACQATILCHTTKVIPQLTRVFTTYGIPEEVKADNGPPFNGSKFARELGFRHRKSDRGGRRQMMMSNVSCRQSKEAQEWLRLKGKQLNNRFKDRLATIMPHPFL